MVLRIYYDFMSQPARAVLLLARANSIPCIEVPVAIRRMEHKAEEYAKINPFQKIPAIDHDGFKLAESVAILRYLCREFPVAKNWCPQDSKIMARVDEYMSWQHLNIRSYGSLLFITKFIPMMLGGDLPSKSKVEKFEEGVTKAVGDIENIWLKKTPFVAGNEVSIADLLASAELEMPGVVGYDVREGNPNITKYLERMKATLAPHYDEVYAQLWKATKMYKETSIKRAN